MSNLIHMNDPLSMLDALIDNTFNRSLASRLPISSEVRSSQMIPAANIKKTESGYDIDLAVPGLSRSDLNIDVDADRITVSSNVEDIKTDKHTTFTTQEFYYSSFQRSFGIPKNANIEGISANYEAGILKISIPSMNGDSIRRKVDIG